MKKTCCMQSLFLMMVVLVFLQACSFGTESRYYYLGMVNSSNDGMEISISQAEGKWILAPGEAKTIKIENQSDKNAKTPRQIHIVQNGSTQTLETSTPYAGYVVIDPAAKACLLAADYGPQYRGSMPLPEGQSDLVLLETYSGKQVYDVSSLKTGDQAQAHVVRTKLGDKLPEKIDIQPGTMPVHLRLIHVPCHLLNDNVALYNYLNDH